MLCTWPVHCHIEKTAVLSGWTRLPRGHCRPGGWPRRLPHPLRAARPPGAGAAQPSQPECSSRVRLEIGVCEPSRFLFSSSPRPFGLFWTSCVSMGVSARARILVGVGRMRGHFGESRPQQGEPSQALNGAPPRSRSSSLSAAPCGSRCPGSALRLDFLLGVFSLTLL